MKSYVFLATGFEEIEAVTPVDVLRRAGMEVITVSVSENRNVTGAHGVTYVADVLMSETDFSDAQWLILPGGLPGATNLYDTPALRELLVKHAAAGGHVAAICASPAVVLAPLGLLDGKAATAYPGFEDALKAHGADARQAQAVVADNIITGNGPASSLPFALAIVAATCGEEKAREVAAGMLYSL